MAKKVDSELADPYMRNISAEIPACIAIKTEPDLEWNSLFGQWRSVSANPLIVGYESSIDLSGYANQSLTFFPEFSVTQENPQRSLLGSEAGGIIDATVITSAPMALTDVVTLIGNSSAPGYPDVAGNGDNLIYEQVMFCRVHLSSVDTSLLNNFTKPIDVTQMGSLEPTAADKLYVYRVVIPIPTVTSGTAYTVLGCPAQRITLRGTMAEEPTIEYMMRLKRSYELANQV